jgi:outer membrane protein
MHTMKSTFTFGLMLAALLFSTTSTAQVKEVHFGHIDTQALLEAMPERNSIQTEIEGAAAQYEEEIVRMQGELEAKVAEYQQKAESWPTAIRAQKEQDITQDQQGLEQFYATVQQELAMLEQGLLEPMIERARKAIEDVGAEEGFTYIFDTSTGGTVYNGGEDVMALVKAKLGL